VEEVGVWTRNQTKFQVLTVPDFSLSATMDPRRRKSNISDFLQMMRRGKEHTLCDMALQRVDYDSNSWRLGCHREN
jgi:hypothetical protein